MARVVLIVDSATGGLVDVAGNFREGGRYAKFAKRMLSLDKNPTLDYGANGGDTLVVSKGGYRGKQIDLLADTVNVPGELKIGGKTVAQIAAGQTADVLDRIDGAEGEVSVVPAFDEATGRWTLLISLDQAVVGRMIRIDDALKDLSGFVSKSDIGDVVQDLRVSEEDTLDDVKGTLRVLLERLYSLAGLPIPAETSSSVSSSSSSSPAGE